MITLYTTHCPLCTQLEKKLNEAGKTFSSITDENEMRKLGITHVPVLKVGDSMMGYADALRWIGENA